MKTNEICKIAKEADGKYVYSILDTTSRPMLLTFILVTQCFNFKHILKQSQIFSTM